MDYNKSGGSSSRGGFSSAGEIPGGGATSGFNEKCLGSGKGGAMGKAEGGAGKSYPGVSSS